MSDKKIAIVMGSKSDAEIVQKATDFIADFEVAVDEYVLSAHRTPNEVADFSINAEKNGYGVIIAAAGMAAALPGAIAAYTTLPVIGLPIQSKFLDGLDSLISMTQMPPGVPVATVGTNAAQNAAILALQILGVSDSDVNKRLKAYKVLMHDKVINSNK